MTFALPCLQTMSACFLMVGISPSCWHKAHHELLEPAAAKVT